MGDVSEQIRVAVSKLILEYMRNISSDQRVITEAVGDMLYEDFQLELDKADQIAEALVDELWNESVVIVKTENDEAYEYEQERREATMGRY